MIVNTVKYYVQPGSLKRVMELSAGVRAQARTMKGCLEYCPTASPYEENCIHSIEKWETVDDLIAYCDSDACKAFQKERNQYLVEGSMDAHVYEVKEIPLVEVMKR